MKTRAEQLRAAIEQVQDLAGELGCTANISLHAKVELPPAFAPLPASFEYDVDQGRDVVHYVTHSFSPPVLGSATRRGIELIVELSRTPKVEAA